MMTDTSLPTNVHRAGDVALLPGEYIECDETGTITLRPSIPVADVKAGQIFPSTAKHWIRYGRI